MFRIRTYNKIAESGLACFRPEKYEVSPNIEHPDAIVLRSADLHSEKLPQSVAAIARAGAGCNNIPVSACTERGIAVFNTPGANANAVKELVLAGLFLCSRKITGGITWWEGFSHSNVTEEALEEAIEKGKKAFAGPEIRGKTLGVVGLGAIGIMVANDALSLGMNVVGYDPYISVDAAWNLSRSVVRGESLEAVLAVSDYVTVHVPLSAATTGLLNAEKLACMKSGARLLNLARGPIVDVEAAAAALDSGHLGAYFCDFPDTRLLGRENVICTPHLGASTPEAEENCAIMACKQIVDYLETGCVRNSVNLPNCRLERRGGQRLIVINRNIPNMVGQITTLLAEAGINIGDLVNHHRGDYAYNIIDADLTNPDASFPLDVLEKIISVNGVVRVRLIP